MEEQEQEKGIGLDGSDVTAVLTELARFLFEHKWLFHFSNVTILMVEIPDCWRRCLAKKKTSGVREAILKAAGRVSQKCPADEDDRLLDEFLLRRNELAAKARSLLACTRLLQDDDRQTKIPTRMTPKKLHEVSMLARVLSRLCDQHCTSHLVDVGCGLGHLERVFSRSCDKIVAVECDEATCGRFLGLSSSVEVVQGRLGDEAEDRRLAKEIFARIGEGKPIGLVGLHCCGDLTPAMMRLFSSTPEFSFMAVVACCYHKVQKDRNKPVSSRVQSEILNSDCKNLIYGPSALRLACQESLDKWLKLTDQELEVREKDFGHRAAFEAFCHDRRLVKRKRKRRQRGSSDFVAKIMDTYEVGEGQLDQDQIKSDFTEYCRQTESEFPLLSAVAALQLCLQSLLEYFITLDRCLFLIDNGLRVELREIFDVGLSPRNIALIASRFQHR